MRRISFSVRHCIEEAFALVASQAKAKHLPITYELCPSVPAQVIGDVTRLKQILVNLLSNAIKFTPEGAIKITVSGERLSPTSGYRLQFAVYDSGIGIPTSKFERLFQPFTQVDASTAREYGGTGLGLANRTAALHTHAGSAVGDERGG